MKCFANNGYGWTCKRCGAEEEKTACVSTRKPSLARFFREGEAEERDPQLSTPALARWKDDARRTLVCPRCGLEEGVSE